MLATGRLPSENEISAGTALVDLIGETLPLPMLSVPGAELRPGDRWKGHLQTQVKGNLREERVLDGGKISIRLS